MVDISDLDMVLVTVGVLFFMALISCVCCLCMKFSDLKMKRYIIDLAKRKGYRVDLEKLETTQRRPSPHLNENCTIMIPDVVIVL